MNLESAKHKTKIVNNALKCCYGSRNTIKMFSNSDKINSVEMNFQLSRRPVEQILSLAKTKH